MKKILDKLIKRVPDKQLELDNKQIESSPEQHTFLLEVWNVTSTKLDFESYIQSGRSKFYTTPYNIEVDMVNDIFTKIGEALQLILRVSSLKEISQAYQNLTNSEIIKHFYSCSHDFKTQRLLCEILIQIIDIQINGQTHNVYDTNNEFLYTLKNENKEFDNYIEYINIILKPNGFYYSISARKLMNVHSDYEIENIESLFPLLDGYGQTAEFIKKAFDEFNSGDYDSSVVNSGRATETIMTCICQLRGYNVDPDKDTFSKLLIILNTNNFFKREEYIKPTLINNLIEGLKEGLPKHRNESSHGASLDAKNSNKYVAKLTLDLMISYIHYFISLDKQL